MIGLDTNVLVRYITQDDAKQARRMDRYFDEHSGERFFVSIPVLCELVWVLDSVYEYNGKQVAAVVDALLTTRQLVVEDKESVRRALGDHGRLGGELADHVIGHHNASAGCVHTVTFDRKLKATECFAVIR